MRASLEPVDDIMAELIKQNGAVNATVEYLGRANGSWLAVPATIGSQIKGPCSRIDLMKQHAGIDVQAMYPAGAAAQGRRLDARHVPQGRGGVPQGRLPVRHRSRHRPPDSVDTAGAIFHSFGAVLVDANEKITVKTRRRAPGARLLQEARAVLPARRAGLGRRLQQQVAGLGQAAR